MPIKLSEEEEAKALQERGFDPRLFGVDPEGKIRKRIVPLSESPSVTQQQLPFLPQKATGPTGLESFARGAAQSSLPTFAGLGGGLAGSSILAPALFGSSVGPVGTLAGGLIGALAAGFGTQYAQQKFLPEDIRKKLFLRPEDLETNPNISLAGEFGPSFLAFNPVKGVTQLPKLARAVGKSFSGGALATAEKAALQNIGINVGVEAGQELAEQTIEGRDFDPKRMALRLGLASVLTEPWGIGRAMGFRGSEDYSNLAPGERTVKNLRSEPLQLPGLGETYVKRPFEQPAPAIEEILRLTGGRLPKGLLPPSQETLFTHKPAGKKPFEQPAPKPIQQLEELTPSTILEKELTVKAAERAAIDVEQTKIKEGMLRRERRRTERQAKREADLYEPLTEGERIQEGYDKGLYQEEPELITILKRDLEGNKEELRNFVRTKLPYLDDSLANSLIDNLVVKVEGGLAHPSLLDLKAGLGKKDFNKFLSDFKAASSEYRKIYKFLTRVPGLNQDVPEFGVKRTPGNLTPEERQRLAGQKPNKETLDTLPSNIAREIDGLSLQQIKDRGFNLEYVNNIIDKSGNLKAGQYDPDTRTIRLSNKSGIDTPFHEIRHGVIQDLIGSTSKGDQKLIQRAKDTLGPNWEELVAKSGGVRGVDRALVNLKGSAKIKARETLKDIWANFKNKLGIANEEDLLRHLAARQELDPRYGERYELFPKDGSGIRAIREGEGEVEEAQKVEGFQESPELKSSEAYKEFAKSTESKQEVTEAIENPKTRKEILTSSTKSPFLRIFGSAIDKVRLLNNPTANYIADRLEKFAIYRGILQGNFWGPTQWKAFNEKGWRLPLKSLNKIDKYASELYTNKKTDIKLTPQEKQLYDFAREELIRVAKASPIREIKLLENYWPQILDKGVAYTWSHNRNSPEGRRYEKLWKDHVKKNSDLDPKQVDRIFEDTMEAMSNPGSSRSIDFGPLHKLAGYGLPVELQEKSFTSRLMRYYRRAAKDIAHHTYIDTDPTSRFILRPRRNDDTLLSIPDSATLPDGTPALPLHNEHSIANVKKFMYDDFRVLEQPNLFAMIRLFNNMLLGPGTAIRNLVQMPLNALTEAGGLRNVGALIKALPKLRQAYKDSLLYGARRMNLGDLDTAAAIYPSKFADRINHLADFFRKGFGREASEQWERAYEFAMGEVVAFNEIGRAIKGNRYAKDWLRKYGKSAEEDLKSFLESGTKKTLADVKDDTIKKIAKEFTDAASGSYDERGLPAGVMEGALSPFMALSRWSIERTNRVYKSVIEPMKQGDLLPALSYGLGFAFTGNAIQELNKLLTGHLPYGPTWQEAFTEDNKMQQARSIASLMQLSAFVGIWGDILKTATEVGSGHVIQHAPFSFPLMDFLAGTLPENLGQYTAAIQNGADPFESTISFMLRTLEDATQGIRIIAANSWRLEEREHSAKYRDMRVFKELQGYPPMSIPISANRYARPEEREFKRTKDIDEAIELAPKVIEQRFKEAEESGGGLNVEKLKSGLKGAKTTSYQTIPDPSNQPLEFLRFMDFLRKTQGDAEASKRLSDWAVQNQLNKVKSQLIPSI